jgi:hypothetical protein
MKAFITITMILLFAFPFPVVSQEEEEPIVEEVQVNWRQVPVFAVDKAGRPVRDLKPGDVKVMLNGQPLTKFDLQKRTFSITEKGWSDYQQPPGREQAVDRGKVMVLLFDNSMSSAVFIQRAKDIAKKVVLGAEENTRLIIMSLEPLMGLNYIGEAITTLPNKTQLLGMIKKNITPKANNRFIRRTEIQLGEMGIVPYVSGWRPGTRDFHKRISAVYFDAFKSLYFYLNSIKENKMIYFFTEGIPNSAIENIKGGASEYTLFLEEMAKDLGACGAVLFLINTMGVDQHTSTYHSLLQGTELVGSSSPLSGENMLRYLAIKSGAAYMEGVPDEVVERLENMHLAYYEISFPDPPLQKGNTMEITIKANQPGIIIHSLRALEKQKLYADMNDMEKNMLMLNLITVNPLAEGKMQAYNVRTAKVKKDKKAVVYNIHIPPGYMNKTIDLYKYWVQNNQEVIHAEKESVQPKSDKLEIQFSMEQLKEKEKQKKPGKVETYFVMVDGAVNTAWVHGMDLYEEDPELPELKEETQVAQIPGGGKTINAGELQRILQGAADYCDRLKKSAFHFYCQEKILETRIPISDAESNALDIDLTSQKKKPDMALYQLQTKAYTNVKGYVFGYRLIKQGSRIKEERDWISSTDNIKVERNQVVQPSIFFSEKTFFAPITLLDRSRQEYYDYQFIRVDDYNNRRAALIKAVPRGKEKIHSVYGNIWIDMEDFSVMKIEADPRSILGYDKLKQLALKLRTKLYLSLVSQFDEIHDGIRFPTKVHMLEKYKGGRIVGQFRDQRGWERTRTEFLYSDYQFFSVRTEVTVRKAGQSVNQ